MTGQPVLWILVPGFALGVALLLAGLFRMSGKRPGARSWRVKYRRRRNSHRALVAMDQQSPSLPCELTGPLARTYSSETNRPQQNQE